LQQVPKPKPTKNQRIKKEEEKEEEKEDEEVVEEEEDEEEDLEVAITDMSDMSLSSVCIKLLRLEETNGEHSPQSRSASISPWRKDNIRAYGRSYTSWREKSTKTSCG